MNSYVTGQTIKALREARGLTQAELADRIMVTAKAVSKWETGRGLPDITLIEPLAAALGVSVMEFMAGEPVVNRNKSANMLKTRFYVCPLCGNIIHSTGEAAISCCGILLPPLEAEETDSQHPVTIDKVEDEQFVSIAHEMTKTHFISFAAFVTCDRVQLVKFYPEGNAETRFQMRGRGILYYCCNRHGLMKQRV